MILFRKLPMDMKRLISPADRSWTMTIWEQVEFFLSAIQRFCAKQGAVECKFDPYLIIGQL